MVRHYFLVSAILIAAGLIISSGLEIYFRYHERKATLALLQKETAAVAALKIDRFIHDVETAMSAAAKGQGVIPEGIQPNFRFELKRLLFLAPAVTEATAFDLTGDIKAQISRYQVSSPELMSGAIKPNAFEQAKQGKHYFGPVYFLRDSEPYMALAVPIEYFKGRVIGILQAEVNLKYIWDVISGISVGSTGYAYAVSGTGQLIAHPDMTLVLQGRNIAELDQVRAAFQSVQNGDEIGLAVAHNLTGQDVISAFAMIPRLDWAVFLERPAGEAYEALSSSLYRTTSLLLLGLLMALFASLFVARRIIRPLGNLRLGAERIGGGDLDYRVDIKTGDEIEALADEFNKMASRLQESYANLEQKVSARTQELASANQKLDVASRYKSQFLANMSHELRTPLNGILGLTEMILDKIYGDVPEKIRSALEDVEKSGRHLLELINDVLDLSKIEAGQLAIARREYSLREIMFAVASAMRPLAAAKNLALSVDCPAQLPSAIGDQRRLTQVLMNLVGNAVKFTERGEVRVSATLEGQSYVVTVSDTGPGIEPLDLARIFDEFQQVDGNESRSKLGTGLGLAIAQRIVAMHGGRIWVESQVGLGSSFSFNLPFRVEPQSEIQ